MALKLKSAKLHPITIDLAIKFREMQALKGERDLKPERAKEQVYLLQGGNLYTMLWGQCLYKGVLYRGNGNHTSNLEVACLQAHNGGLDERSTVFFETCLAKKGGKFAAIDKPEDLPVIREKETMALIEDFTADNEDDLVKFFRRYDSPSSVRKAPDLLGIYVGEHDDLRELSKKRVSKALAGVRKRAAIDPEPFGFSGIEDVKAHSTQSNGPLLRVDKVRECVRWMIESVNDETLYRSLAGASLFAEVWSKYDEERATAIVAALEKLIEDEDATATVWVTQLNKQYGGKRNSIESLLKKGRQAVAVAMATIEAEVAMA